MSVDPNEKSLKNLNPLSLLHQGAKAVPAVRYAVGAVGIAAAVAIIRGLLPDVGIVALLPILGGAIVCMAILVLLAALVSTPQRQKSHAAMVFVWAVCLFVIAFMIMTVTAVAFHQPKAWADLILPDSLAMEEKRGDPPSTRATTEPVGLTPHEQQPPAHATERTVSSSTPGAAIEESAPTSVCGPRSGRTAFVVVRQQTFTEAVLPLLQAELGCDHFGYRMGNSAFVGYPSNTISFGPETDFRRVQAALRASRAVGATIQALFYSPDIPANTIWLCNMEAGSGFTQATWRELENATTQAAFLEASNLAMYGTATPETYSVRTATAADARARERQ